MKSKFLFSFCFWTLFFLFKSQAQINCNNPITVSFTGLDTAYKTTDSAVTLHGSPTGGMFYGTGIVKGKFYPSNLSVGNYTLVYAYVDTNGCSNAICESVAIIKNTNIDTTSKPISGVYLYPNPNNGIFNVSLTIKGTQAIGYSIFNISGQQIYNETQQNATGKIVKTFDITKFSAGIYLFKIITKDSNLVYKLIKQKI